LQSLGWNPKPQTLARKIAGGGYSHGPGDALKLKMTVRIPQVHTLGYCKQLRTHYPTFQCLLTFGQLSYDLLFTGNLPAPSRPVFCF
jgi:hypothetical protein